MPKKVPKEHLTNIFRRYFYGGLLRTPDRVLNGRNSSFEPLILLDLQNTFEEEAGKSSTLNELEVIGMTGHLESKTFG